MPAGQTTVGTIGKVAAGFGMALAIMLAAVPTRGQLNESAPIVVKKPKNSATPSKASWLKAEVIHADANSMIVREQANGMMLHTFTYTAGLQPQMQRVVDQGGYQIRRQGGDSLSKWTNRGAEGARQALKTPLKLSSQALFE